MAERRTSRSVPRMCRPCNSSSIHSQRLGADFAYMRSLSSVNAKMDGEGTSLDERLSASFVGTSKGSLLRVNALVLREG